MRIFRSTEVYRKHSRRRVVRRYLQKSNGLASSWVNQCTEASNFYYPLTEMNRQDLISTVAIVTGKPVAEIRAYLMELLEDEKLHDHLRGHLHSKHETKDSLIAFGRREGWYLFIRALKPKLVVETGVHHGVGASLIAAALLKNREAGYQGQYLGTDINSSAGSLFCNEYASVGEIRFGDSISTLTKLESKIDIFINDSDHSAEYEMREYVTIRENLARRSLILGDNSHVTSCLREFAEQNKRPFLFFKEVPDSHWYPGGGIGISPSQIPID
jgi:predicted O-methyltransferase YrrM